MLLVLGAVLVLTLVLASFVSGVMTHAALDSYETTDRLFLERRLSQVVSRWHDDHRGWDRLDAAVTQIGPALGRRVVILDEGGTSLRILTGSAQITKLQSTRFRR